MITPPFSTPSFYTAVLENSAAEFIIGLLAPQMSKDIKTVLLTSKDISSDIEATNELQLGVNAVMSRLLVDGEQPSIATEYNPMYMPNMAEKMLSDIEVDNDGDIICIAGFSNPFISMTLKTGSIEFPGSIDCKVNFKQFELPPMFELFNTEQKFLS